MNRVHEQCPKNRLRNSTESNRVKNRPSALSAQPIAQQHAQAARSCRQLALPRALRPPTRAPRRLAKPARPVCLPPARPARLPPEHPARLPPVHAARSTPRALRRAPGPLPRLCLCAQRPLLRPAPAQPALPIAIHNSVLQYKNQPFKPLLAAIQ